MKFNKRYREFMEGQDKLLPAVKLKKLKGVLKQHNDTNHSIPPTHDPYPDSEKHHLRILSRDYYCSQDCPVCDGTFFPALLKDLSDIVTCFNKQAERFLELQLASGFDKCFGFLKIKLQGKHDTLIQEGKSLITYAIINAEAIHKILKKYDKVHHSIKGQKFKSDIQSMQLEVLKSPWLCELMAFHINMLQRKDKTKIHRLFEDCSFQIDEPSITATLFDTRKLTLDLTCSICLETVFDPVSLVCGHIFCYMCACSAASVTSIDGLGTSESITRCPLCRKEGVFAGAVPMVQINILLRRNLPKYWEERRQKERQTRIQEAKDHWENHCRAVMGIN